MQQAISWANIYSVLYRYMALLDHNEANNWIESRNVFNSIHTIRIRTDPKVLMC